MSDTIPPNAQGRWRGQRRGSRGPTRGLLHPTMPLPDDIPAAEEIKEETMSDDGQRKPSGNPGGIGGPQPPAPGPSNPPPPNPPSE